MTTKLPPGVLETDLSYPKKAAMLQEVAPLYGSVILTLHHTERFGWCIATLQIARAGRRHRQGVVDRTYAVSLQGDLVRVGLGPHVTRTITIYVKESRQAALQYLIDLRNKGAVKAHDTRDRISTRRAQSAGRRWPF